MSMIKGKILVIDDEVEMRSLLDEFFKSEGHQVHTFAQARDVLEQLKPQGEFGMGGTDSKIDLILSDIKMAQMDGLQFLSEVRMIRPEIPVVLMTAFGSIDTAIEAMKRGAHNYLVKPFKLTEISVITQKALEQSALLRENHTLREEVKNPWRMGDVIGKSAGMRSVFDLVSRIADSKANVLINGESGTGKEMIARAIHNHGRRNAKPFIPINCTAIPEALLESELFGHAKGAFTGAISRKKGLFEEADGGTLFLDEIGDMSPALQAKLLRVLQDRKIRAVGENSFHDIDVRIIAATHKDLKSAIKEGLFREDLFYRLSVIPIIVPPLRERSEDIPYLAEYFLTKFSAANHSRIRGLTKAAMSKLVKLRWEGNVRELENVIERAVVLCRDGLIDETDIPDPMNSAPQDFFLSATSDLPSLTQLEERYMRLVLDRVAGRKDKAAQILGINRRTLYRKEREYGLVADDAPQDETHEGSDDPEGDSDI